MFGKPIQKTQDARSPQRPASEVAKIQGHGLIQLIITSISPLSFFLFLNDRYVPAEEVQSISVSLEAPEDGAAPTVRATLTHRIIDVSGASSWDRQELFPGTIEIIVADRRISMTNTRPDSLEGTWIDLGLRPDGTGNEISGVRSFSFLLEDGILGASLTLTEREPEPLIPI